jgi:hypothetical protein
VIGGIDGAPGSAPPDGLVVDGLDRWPTFDLSPADYERAVQRIVTEAGHEVVGFEARHLDEIEAPDGVYVIDVTVRFRFLGADFLMLFECKRHASPVKREDVQVLHAKLQSIGAQKGRGRSSFGPQAGRTGVCPATRDRVCSIA